MSPLLPLLFLGGAYLVMRGGGGSRSSAAPSNFEGKCITPPRTEFDDLPDEPFWNAFKYALWVDSDPKSIEAFAASCEAVCQPAAAAVLRQKAKDLRALGVPDGYSPNGKPPATAPTVSLPLPDGPVQIPVPPTYDPTGGYGYLPPDVLSGAKVPESFPFPVPGIEYTPEPKTGNTVPEVVPGLPLPTPELGPKMPAVGKRAGCRSSSDTQWWSVPAKAGQSAWSITQDYTGSGNRYAELIAANPEKKTVGTPGKTGYNFASLKVGERLRIPKAWNVYVDEQGNADGKGKIWPVCEGAPAPSGGPDEWPATATDPAHCWKGFKTTGDATADLMRLSTTCAKGMTLVSPPGTRTFKEGESFDVKYPLVAGSYRFIAVGGKGTVDVNMRLLAPDGSQIAADITPDDQTAVLHMNKPVTITDAGIYTLRVELKKGNGEIAGAVWRA